MSAHQAAPKPRHRFMTTAIAFGLLLAFSIPAFAGGPHDKATGSVEWTARSGALPGIVTSFDAHDEAPGMHADRGTITTYRPADSVDPFPGGTITIDLACVNVDGDEAWMAGVAVQGDGGYASNVGDVYLYWVKDGSTPGAEADKIGGRSYGDLTTACGVVESGGWTGTGDVDSGNLKTHYFGD